MAEVVRFRRNRFTTGPKGMAYENLVVKNTAANDVATLWDDCPLLVDQFDPAYATYLDTEFMQATPATSVIPGWTTTIATAGTVTNDAANGLKITSGAVTAGQGINFQQIRTPFTVAANKPVWFECGLKFTGLTGPKIQFLAGLAAAQTALITSNAVGTDDKIAFDGVTTTGVVLSDACASTTSGTGTGFTLSNATFRIGFKATTTAVTYWVNNALVNTLTANIPTTALAPSFVVQGNATDTPVMFLQWLRVFGIN